MNFIPENTCIYAIGDIHGRADLLMDLHTLILKDSINYPNYRRVIIYLGDYIDRGPQTKQVIEAFIHTPLPQFESIYIKGNHEGMLLNFLQKPQNSRTWLKNGGFETLISYQVLIPTADPLNLKRLKKDFQKKIPEEHLLFFKSLKLYHIEGDYFFCHGGINPNVALDQQTEEDLTWIREPFLTSTENHGKIIVHGHTVSKQPTVLFNRIGIDTGAVFTNILTCLVLTPTSRYFLNT